MKSPARKKTRAGRPDTPGPPKSIIKMHDHNHKRVILEAAVLLTDKNPYLQFAEMIRNLMGNALMVDVYFQIDPISKVSPHPPLRKKTEVPNNLTLLTEYIKISGNMMAFQKKKVFSSGGGSSRKKKTEKTAAWRPLLRSGEIRKSPSQPTPTVHQRRGQWPL